ncbi:MAG: DUF6630 family protein [Polyangiales bacterium]
MERLAPGQAKLAGQVAMAVDHPMVYVRAHGRRLAERAISEPVPHLPRVAVLDALVEKKLLAEIDANASAEDVLFAVDKLASLPKKRGRFKTLEKRDDFDDLDADTALRLAGELVAEQGFVLAALDVGSDAFPVVAIASGDVNAIATLAKDAGFRGLAVFRGEREATAEDREAKQKIAAQKARLEAEIVVANPVWRPFLASEKYFNVKIATLAIDINEGTLGLDDRRSTTKQYGSWEETRAAAEAMIGERRADGYEEVPLDVYLQKNREAKARAGS